MIINFMDFKASTQDQIEIKYNNINQEWLRLHYNMSVATVIIGFLLESVFSLYIIQTDMLTISVSLYYIKYLIVPTIINAILLLIETWVMKNIRIEQEIKIYIVSIMYVIIGFTLFTVHVAFSSLYLFFIIAILMTIVYANYKLTIVTSIISMIAFMHSEIFIEWDKDKVSIFESSQELCNFLIEVFIVGTFSCLGILAVNYQKKKNDASILIEKERIHLLENIRIDELTGTYNRKAFQDVMNQMEELEEAVPYTLAIVDIDNFKEINDSFGHQMGDKCLVVFSEILLKFEKEILAFRYGGDEFCLIFENITLKKASNLCKQIQEKLIHWNEKNNDGINVTFSAGISENLNNQKMEEVFSQADKALYKAKKIKNTIYIYQE